MACCAEDTSSLVRLGRTGVVGAGGRGVLGAAAHMRVKWE